MFKVICTVFYCSKLAWILHHLLVIVFAEIHVSLHPTPPTALTTQLEEKEEESLFL